MDFDYKKFRRVSEKALIPAGKYVRGAIQGKVDLSEYLVQGNRSIVTVVDRMSQEISRPIIQREYPDVRLNQEESNQDTGNLESDLVIQHDPLDGTSPFLIGAPNPTIILSLYNRKDKEVLAVATLEPATGRFWYSSKGNGAWMNVYNFHDDVWNSEDKNIRVNDHGMMGGRVLSDVAHPFKRKLKDGSLKKILTQNGRRRLSSLIEDEGAREAFMNSNGINYALTATGRPTLVGNITTAIGGPFDIAGIRHVIEAGGVAQCYKIEVDGKHRIFNKTDCPQDTENADMVIAANNKDNLIVLERILDEAVREN